VTHGEGGGDAKVSLEIFLGIYDKKKCEFTRVGGVISSNVPWIRDEV